MILLPRFARFLGLPGFLRFAFVMIKDVAGDRYSWVTTFVIRSIVEHSRGRRQLASEDQPSRVESAARRSACYLSAFGSRRSLHW